MAPPSSSLSTLTTLLPKCSSVCCTSTQLHTISPRIIDISRVQDEEVGDGTTSVVVLAGELLREAELLVNQKIHPMTIIDGFRQAAGVALKRLEAIAMDNKDDEAAFRKDLENIAKTTLSSKVRTAAVVCRTL